MTPRRTIVVTDYSFPDLALETAVLAQGDCDIVGHHCSNEAELMAAVANADAVITQFAKINANVIGAMTRARAIVRYGIGVDNVDLDAARAHGLPVIYLIQNNHYGMTHRTDEEVMGVRHLARRAAGFARA